MKQNRTFLLLGLVMAVLVLGVVYAAISNVTLNVTGNVTAAPNADNFKVAFSGRTGSDGDGTVTASASGQSATMSITGLTTVNQQAVVTFEIKNSSSDINALLSTPSVTISNSEYFSVTAEYSPATTNLAANNTTNLKITVTLKKSPISNVSTTVKVTFTAEPTYSEGSGSGNTVTTCQHTNRGTESYSKYDGTYHIVSFFCYDCSQDVELYEEHIPEETCPECGYDHIYGS